MNFEKFKEFVTNRYNFGDLPGANAKGMVTNASCGDMTMLYFKVDDETELIEDARYFTFGCGFSQAMGVVITELCKGKTISEAELITERHIDAVLDGIPEAKRNYLSLIHGLLQDTIRDYREKKGKEAAPVGAG
ncbi:MAG: iron-sulfur cluster assembly scaffold protein [bacterium]|jgi:NifU-like protein